MILKLNNITKKFGNISAVKNISFEINAGERIGLIGANGSGKTTISEVIAGITQPTSGQINYRFKYKHKPQEAIGMQFQDSTYPSGLTVKDIIKFARNLHKMKISNGELKEVIEYFKMDEFFNRKARSLSGGQRQKLNILLSVLHKPKLVILDELSTGLDVASREDIIKFTKLLLNRNKSSAIIVSHNMDEIKALCDKVVVLDGGKIKQIAQIKDIEEEYGTLEDYMKLIIRTKVK